LRPANIPELRLSGMNWLITQVAFVVDLERGRVAEINLMPPEAETGDGTMRPYATVTGMAFGLLAVWGVLVQFVA
jgi:hypothetical protein